MESLLAFSELCHKLDSEYGKPEENSIVKCNKKIDGKICGKENHSTNICCDGCHEKLRKNTKIYSKIKHFRTILRALSENNLMSINDITLCDGLDRRSRSKQKRSSIYNRIIQGNEKNNVKGLVEKGLIKHVVPKIVKREKQYRLTEIGVLYAVYLFSSTKFNKIWNIPNPYQVEDDPLIDRIAENYQDYFPMVFGKWIFLKENHIPVHLIRILAGFNKIQQPTIMLMRMGREISGKNQTKNPLADDFSLWFYIIILKMVLRTPSEKRLFFEILKKDPEIGKWLQGCFSDYQSDLIKEMKDNQTRLYQLRSDKDEFERNENIENEFFEGFRA